MRKRVELCMQKFICTEYSIGKRLINPYRKDIDLLMQGG